MNSNLILKSDVLDIIFEKRNKDYGAYILRKFYPNRVKIALGLMLLAAIVFSALTFLPEKTTSLSTRPYIMDQEFTKVKDEPKKQEKKNETLKPEVKATAATERKFVAKMEIVKDNVKTDPLETIKETDVISSNNTNPVDPGTVIVQPEKPGEAEQPAAPKIDISIPMDPNSVDVLPSYPGGLEALRKFLERNLNNPKEMEEGESVSVRIRFVVNYNGKLQSFVTVQDGGEEFNKEVVRVLKKMPEWIPGKAKGENVSVYYTIPVKFVPAN
jgi:periplasmic protein TonB